MSLHDIISWVHTWTECPTIGYMVDNVPFNKKHSLEKSISEQDDLLQRIYLRKNKYKENERETDEEKLKTCQSNLSSIGLELFGTNEPLLIHSYFERIEYTSVNQQYSTTHPVYIISEYCKELTDYVVLYLDRMYTLYNEGHSELHTIVSPFELHAPQWIARECIYGWVYHHPSYIAYRIQSFVNDRSYTHLMTNCVSPYLRYHPSHKVDSISSDIHPETRIMYMPTEYNYELTIDHTIQALEYDTPICIWGLVPYFTPLLPLSLFQLQLEYVFPEDNAIPVFMIRGVYHTLDDEVQKHISNDIFIKELVKQTQTSLSYETISLTCTLSILPDEWKEKFFASDYHLVKVTHFSLHMNAFLTKRFNFLLYKEHPNPKIT